MSKKETYFVEVHWDEKAEVFYVESTNVPGLNAETDTINEMTVLLEELVPFLVQENQHANSEKTFMDVGWELNVRQFFDQGTQRTTEAYA